MNFKTNQKKGCGHFLKVSTAPPAYKTKKALKEKRRKTGSHALKTKQTKPTKTL